MGVFMAFVKGGSETLFSEESYKAYVAQKNIIHNERLRPDDETIFDVVLSGEADFTKHPKGKEILDVIRGYK
jgi:hypothetical protein